MRLSSVPRAIVLGALLGACTDSNGPDGGQRVRYQSVSAGFVHTCGLATTGELYCWGDAPFITDSVPQAIPLPETITGITSASSIFGYSTCAWTSGGTDYCWGGWTPMTDMSTLYGNGVDPVVISGAGPLTSLSAARSHGCGLRVDSTAACWGGFLFGKRGLLQPDDTTFSSLTAAQIGSDLRFTHLSAGWTSTCGIMTDGQVSCWGDSTMLGGGAGSYLTSVNPCFYRDFPCRIEPIAIPGVTGAISVSNGGERTCAVGNTGVSCWGSRLNGVEQVPVPVGVKGVSVGLVLACALGVDGKAWCWGDVTFDALDLDAHEPPTAFAVPGKSFVQVSVGRRHACGLADDGSLYCWGATTAALGNGKGQIAQVPVRVAEPRR